MYTCDLVHWECDLQSFRYWTRSVTCVTIHPSDIFDFSDCMQFTWCNVTLLQYHKTVSVNHWICARNSKHACYCAFFLLMCSKGCHGGWGEEVGGLILTCHKHWHTGVLNVCKSASQQLAVVLLSCWTGVIDFVSCEWFSCFNLMRVLPWCDCLQWTGCSVFRINTELGLSISLSPMFIFCTLFWRTLHCYH